MTMLFQDRVLPWMLECFGPTITMDATERNHRFLEEALEAVQSLGCTREEAHQLVDYVFDRPAGDPDQEIGGAMVTLAALCIAADRCMHEAGEAELARIWTKIDVIRAKQASKPKHSPLPVSAMISTAVSDILGNYHALQYGLSKAAREAGDDISAGVSGYLHDEFCKVRWRLNGRLDTNEDGLRPYPTFRISLATRIEGEATPFLVDDAGGGQ